jgi:hypothetical protein
MASPTVSPTNHPVNGHHKVELEWSDITAGHFPTSPARAAWREAVTEVAARAKAALPTANGRIDAAVKMVLAGDVELLPDGTARVASQSNGATSYVVVNGECSCKDYPKAPAQMCKHRLAYGIYKRATRLVAEKLQSSEVSAHKTTHQDGPGATIVQQDDSQATPVTHTEAPASANAYISINGYRVQLTVRGADEQDVLARLIAVLAQYPISNDNHEPPATPEGWCAKHAVQMTRSKDGKHFYHKIGETPDGKAV